jgi:ABC-type transporter Mla MlaB component
MEHPGRSTTGTAPLRISAIVTAARTTVELDGEITDETVPGLQAGLAVVLGEADNDITVDLGRVPSLCPEALRVLLETAEAAEHDHRHVEFRHPARSVRRMLEWTGGPRHPAFG